MREWLSVAVAGISIVLPADPADAFRPIAAGDRFVRWDAAPRMVNGEERSLDGGLRYSLEGGSYEALRDQLTWVAGNVPPLPDFEAAVRRAFENWTIVDPATGSPAAFYFVEDLATLAIDDPGNPNRPGGYTGLNAGAEIDIFAETPHAGAQFGASVVVFVDSTQDDLTLTSGTTAHPGRAIAGVDIRINPAIAWSLRGFEVLLTHEIGHALGLADLESTSTPFFDDDLDLSSPAAALATLTNAFAPLIDVFDPEASPLVAYPLSLNTNPGLDSPGVTLLMETEGIFDLLFTEPRLQNDEFAGRQFLYPVAAPEPGLGALLAAGGVGLVAAARCRRRNTPPRRDSHLPIGASTNRDRPASAPASRAGRAPPSRRTQAEREAHRRSPPQKPRSPEHLAAFRAIPGKGNSALCTRDVDPRPGKCRKKRPGPKNLLPPGTPAPPRECDSQAPWGLIAPRSRDSWWISRSLDPSIPGCVCPRSLDRSPQHPPNPVFNAPLASSGPARDRRPGAPPAARPPPSPHAPAPTTPRGPRATPRRRARRGPAGS